jgi:hypothetical protein
MNNGGPAFPRPASEFTKNGTLPDGNDAEHAQVGMTLRDYFAAMAMQGLLAATGLEHVSAVADTGDAKKIFDLHAGLAQGSYLVADAMLAERSKK